MRSLALLAAAAALLYAGGIGGSLAAVAAGAFCATLWAAMLACSWQAGRCARVSAEAASPSVPRGGRAGFELVAATSSRLPLPSVEARVSAAYLEEGLGSRAADVSVSVAPRGSARVTLGSAAPHCGVLEARVEEARAHDPLGLFSPRLSSLKLGSPARVTVVPAGSAPLELRGLLRAIGAFGPEGGLAGAGPGPAAPDVREVGEWHEGDPLSRVHWKLSAREGKLQVKRYEDDPRLDAVLAVSPCAPLDGRAVTESADGRDAWYEACANTAVGLASAGASFECLWQGGGEGVRRAAVAGPEDVPGLLRALVETGAARHRGADGLVGLMRVAREAAGGAPVLLLDGSLALREGRAEVARFDASGKPASRDMSNGADMSGGADKAEEASR